MYYDLRDKNRRSDKFSTQIIKKKSGIELESSSKMFKTLLDQGFIINKE